MGIFLKGTLMPLTSRGIFQQISKGPDGLLLGRILPFSVSFFFSDVAIVLYKNLLLGIAISFLRTALLFPWDIS